MNRGVESGVRTGWRTARGVRVCFARGRTKLADRLSVRMGWDTVARATIAAGD
jgi:hypothetical protein